MTLFGAEREAFLASLPNNKTHNTRPRPRRPQLTPRSLDPEADHEQIRRWIHACDAQHQADCVPPPVPSRSAAQIPDWVIDTHAACIVRGHTAGRYVALSYRWPQQEPLLLLERRSLPLFRTPGFLAGRSSRAGTPAKIREAMALVRGAGERYLWADRFCIVQDDAASLRQVDRMHHIYAGAYFTIIAATSGSIYGGGGQPAVLPAGRRAPARDEAAARRAVPFRYFRNNSPAMRLLMHSPSQKLPGAHPAGQCDHHVQGEDEEEEEEEEADVEEDDNEDDDDDDDDEATNTNTATSLCASRQGTRALIHEHYARLSRSEWGSRGWTYQEQILSARAVVLLDDHMFWDCQRALWDRDGLGPGGGATRRGTQASHHRLLGQRLLRSGSGSAPAGSGFALYVDLVCPYNRRDLGNPLDVLRAFAGILRSLEPALPGGFAAGLPLDLLDHALLWQPLTRAARRCGEGGHRTLPSWSWAAWQCEIDPYSLRTGLLGGPAAAAAAAAAAARDSPVARGRAATWRTYHLVDWSVLWPRDLPPRPEPPSSSSSFLAQERPESQAVAALTGLLSWAADFFWPPAAPAPASPTPRGPAAAAAPRPAGERVLLRAKAQRAFFSPAVVVTELFERATGLRRLEAAPKEDAFEAADREREWYLADAADDDSAREERQQAAAAGEQCGTLVLRDARGGFAGLVRLMGGPPGGGGDLELIAISAGGAALADLDSAYEERCYLERCYSLRHNRRPYGPGGGAAAAAGGGWSGPVEYFGPPACGVCGEGEAGPGCGRPRDPIFRQGRDWDARAAAGRGAGGRYEFYNVLWVEREGGVAYRRGCGRVPRDVWDRCALPAEEVVLG